MGYTLRQVIFDVGGGVGGGKEFKAVQMGGPSGGCLPASLLDTLVDYDAITATGAIMGSGGMIVADTSTCMVDLARYFLSFTQEESCGKCVPCRIGTKRMLEILNRICEGKGEETDIEKLQTLAGDITGRQPLRPGRHRPQPGADHPEVLHERVRGPHPQPQVHGRGLSRPDHPVHRPRHLHRLRGLRQGLPGRGHQRREEEAPRPSTRTPASAASCA